jgi:bifunctional DNase/RNase
VIELEVIGVTARPRSDEQKQRLRDQTEEALAEQPGPAPSDEQRQRLRDQAEALAEQPEPWVRLKERAGRRVLEFTIGPAEAMAIAWALQGHMEPRPMTHDLIGNLLRAFDDVSVIRLIITKREGGTFYAELELRHRERVISLDCRPSDGIAVAVRLGVPIVAAGELEPVLAAA